MANVLIPKHSETPGAVPTTGQLADGEFAINTADKKIYQRVGSNVILVANVGAGGGSASITQVSINFGRTPINEKTFNIIDAGISALSKLIVTVSSDAQTDENAGVPLNLSWKCNAGSFDLTCEAVHPNKLLQGIFKINYLAG